MCQHSYHERRGSVRGTCRCICYRNRLTQAEHLSSAIVDGKKTPHWFTSRKLGWKMLNPDAAVEHRQVSIWGCHRISLT